MHNRRFVPEVELLESRLVPYSLTSYKWANLNLSASFMPDATKIGTQSSNLFRTYDAKYATAVWENQFARALQSWAVVSPLNFHFVNDSGAAQGSTGLIQNDSRFGDIRLGAFPSSSSYLASSYFPSTTTTKGGDITLNSSKTYNIGTSYDLYSVLVHETGHALGLNHSAVSGSVLYPSVTKVYSGLSADDIAGIQAKYGARQADSFDALAANDSLATASALTVNNGSVTVTADLRTITDVDNYRVTVPAGSNGTLTVTLDASQISLLIPKLAIYNAAGQLVGSTSASTYGTAVTVTLTGVVAGQTYTLQATGATSDIFHVGGYNLKVQFGGFSTSTTSTSTTTTSTSSTGGTAGAALALPGGAEFADAGCDCDHHHAEKTNQHLAQDADTFWGFVPETRSEFGVSLVHATDSPASLRLEAAWTKGPRAKGLALSADDDGQLSFTESPKHRAKEADGGIEEARADINADLAEGDVG